LAADGGARGFARSWSALDLWSPKSFVRNVWHWPADQIKPLAHALTASRTVADASEAGLKLLSLRFDGSMDERPAAPETLKGKLYLARPGDVVFSKIDLRNGAIGIVPPAVEKAAFTTEFPIYQVRADVADSRYIQLLFRSNFFRATVNGMVSGASGRKRVATEQLEAMQVPLPPLHVQQAIVTQWAQAQTEIRQAEAQAVERETQAQAAFLEALGLAQPKAPSTARRAAFALNWSALERWGAESNRLALTGGSSAQARYPMVEGHDCIESVTHGCSASPSAQPTALEVLKISAVTKGWLDVSEKKFAPDLARLRSTYALRRRTNGTLAYVGTAALVQDDLADMIFPDKVIRVRLKGSVMPAYFWQVLKVPFLRAQIESFVRTAVGNYAIGGKDVWKLRLPLPPLDIQKSLVQSIAQARTDAAHLRQQAAQKRQQAKQMLERALLGETGALEFTVSQV
jgi:type I restriction enzyme S subunit